MPIVPTETTDDLSEALKTRNEGRGFHGEAATSVGSAKAATLYVAAGRGLQTALKLTAAEAVAVLDSKAGRKLADAINLEKGMLADEVQTAVGTVAHTNAHRRAVMKVVRDFRRNPDAYEADEGPDGDELEEQQGGEPEGDGDVFVIQNESGEFWDGTRYTDDAEAALKFATEEDAEKAESEIVLSFSQADEGEEPVDEARNAATAFSNAMRSVRRRMKELDKWLKQRESEFQTSGSKNWGYVGDVNHVAGLLAQALGESVAPETLIAHLVESLGLDEYELRESLIEYTTSATVSGYVGDTGPSGGPIRKHKHTTPPKPKAPADTGDAKKGGGDVAEDDVSEGTWPKGSAADKALVKMGVTDEKRRMFVLNKLGMSTDADDFEDAVTSGWIGGKKIMPKLVQWYRTHDQDGSARARGKLRDSEELHFPVDRVDEVLHAATTCGLPESAPFRQEGDEIVLAVPTEYAASMRDLVPA